MDRNMKQKFVLLLSCIKLLAQTSRGLKRIGVHQKLKKVWVKYYN